MKKNNLQSGLFAVSILALAGNLLWIPHVFSQTTGDQESLQEVNRSGGYSFYSVPQSINFGSIEIPTTKTQKYSDATVDGVLDSGLPTTRRLTVQDLRGDGGFIVNISVDSNFTAPGSGTIPLATSAPDDNFKLVTTSALDTVTGSVTDHVIYENGFAGYPDEPTVKNIVANVNTNGTNFGLPATFNDVPGNALTTTTPIEVLNGTLDDGEGRIGRITVGASFMLQIPAFQSPGSYFTTITWTLQDATNP